MDPMTTDPVQPEAGQGGEPTGGAPYAEFLDRIPEDQRGVVEPVFKDWDAQTTRKFQEHSQYRDQWAPYEQAGIHQYNPADLQQLIEFGQMAADPAAYQEWLRAQAEQAGLIAPDHQAGATVDPSVEQLLQQQLSPVQQQLQEIAQWRQEQQLQANAAQISQTIDARMRELQAEHGEFPTDVVAALAANHTGLDPRTAIDRAFADYQRFAAQIEQGFVNRKLGQPAAPETGGGTDASPPAVTSLREASQIAMERLRQSRGA